MSKATVQQPSNSASRIQDNSTVEPYFGLLDVGEEMGDDGCPSYQRVEKTGSWNHVSCLRLEQVKGQVDTC